MAATGPTGLTAAPASHVLGRKLDSIPFSAYHVVVIVVLGLVGFVEGYDLALTGSLLVLAKGPLHLAANEVRALATWPTFLVVIGGFAAAAMSDRISRVAVMQAGVIISTLCTLLILLVQLRAAIRPEADHRFRAGFYCLGTVSDRRRADAGAAPAHLCRDL
jgi:MFS family permease